MSVSKAHARKLANRILREKKKNRRPWRTIVAEDFPMKGADGKPIIKPGTLNRFAKSKGNWIPTDCQILKALGLWKKRSPYAGLPRWFHRTPAALEYFQRKKAQIKKMSDETREAAKRSKQ
jgi:hypothetical protein